MSYYNKLFLFLFFIFVTPSQTKSTINNFDENHIKDSIFFAQHSYVLTEVLSNPQRNVQMIEQPTTIAGINVYPFAGKTGGLWSGDGYLHAMGGVYRQGNRIYIAFHGSRTNPMNSGFFPDWVSNFKFFQDDAQLDHEFNGFIHRGFSQVAQSSYDSMVRQIHVALGGTPPQNCEFIFCGHSLGGAVSTIAARRFSAKNGQYLDLHGTPHVIFPNGFDKSNVKLVTFSSPHVGDADFARTFSSDIPVALRFYHQLDFVEKVPIGFLSTYWFNHVGRPVPFLFGEVLASKLASPERWGELIPGLREMQAIGGAAALGNLETSAAAALAVIVLKMLHVVPDEDVIIRAYRHERQYADDPDYQGVSYLDVTRNNLLRGLFSPIIN